MGKTLSSPLPRPQIIPEPSGRVPAAAYDGASMIPAAETFEGAFPFQARFSTAPGFRMHYVDEGSGEPIILLHGEPTWGYIYRKFIPSLAESWRVIVPDHMGFGKSETPQDREYTLETHVSNLAALVDDLGLDGITLAGQDWGGPMLAAYTVRHPERVKRICLMNSLCGYGGMVVSRDASKPPKLHESEWFRWVISSHRDGSYYKTMGNLGANVGKLMGRLGTESSLSELDVQAYAAPFESPAECKGAVEFPLDVALNRIGPYVKAGASGVPALRSKPAMLAEGMRDRAIPPGLAIADFQALFPSSPVVRLERAGHFCQEDAAPELVALIQLFLQMT